MLLNKKWKELRNTANTENVLMTISDIVKHYERGRININPSYQRTYRWTNEQKTKFIESLLLKYPIPPIITIKTENDNGLYNYEIIDGVQRLSTIFEFVKAKKEKELPIKGSIPLEKLEGANSFIEINGKDYNDFAKEEFDFIFDSSTLLFINLTTNQENVKYEMFERLNTLSTPLTPQEFRNTMLDLKDKDIYKNISSEIAKLSKDIFNDKDMRERIDLEYFVEFSLIKRYNQYKKDIEQRISRLDSKNKKKHFDSFLSSFVRLVNIEELQEDVSDYKEFIGLNKNLNFKTYDLEKDEGVGTPVKFFFELLGFLFFKEKSLISKEFYKKNFSDTYGNIMKNKLHKNNPNPKLRFELAHKIILGNKNGNNIFNT